VVYHTVWYINLPKNNKKMSGNQGKTMGAEEQHAINLLKAKWQQAELAFQQKESLTIKREEIEQLIEQSTKLIESSELSAYRSLTSNLQNAKLMLQESEVQRAKLKQLNSKKRDIDIVLDESEEVTLETLNELKEELADKIISLNADKKSAYEKLKAQRNGYQLAAKESAELGVTLGQLDQLIGTALAHRQIIKRQGLLSYIFGVNPNIAITKNLHAAELLIRTTLPKIYSGLHQNQLFRETYMFLEELAPHCVQRWGFGKIDQFFTQSHQQLLDLSEQMRILHKNSLDLVNKNEKELINWLNEN
jgi:ferredoxin-fold anticodon binding domain-containing protein